VLELGHTIKGGLRGIPVDDMHRDVVRGMAVHFLLKWHGQIHNRTDFAMMKAFRRKVSLKGMTLLNEAMGQRLRALDEHLAAPTWWAFRVRRKIKHLRR
jgi:hypothetical protein